MWICKTTCCLIRLNDRLNFQYKVNPVFIKHKCYLWKTRALPKQKDVSQGYTFNICLALMSWNQEASLKLDHLLLSLISIILLDFAANNSIGKDSSIIFPPKQDARANYIPQLTFWHKWKWENNKLRHMLVNGLWFTRRGSRGWFEARWTWIQIPASPLATP